jgi:hypothetical protein
MEPTILVRITCQQESAAQVAEDLTEAFKSFNQAPAITVTDAPGRPGSRLIVIDTEKPFSDEVADDIFSEPVYDGLFRLPGVLAVDVSSSDDEPLTAMTEAEANALAGRITQEAPWLSRVTVKPAHEVNDEFAPDSGLFVCWIEGQQFSAEIYTAVEWARLIERLDYEQRLSEYMDQVDEPDARPFRRYVLDAPVLPSFGSYAYLELERRAVRNFLLDAGLPPWRSAVRSHKGARAIHAISGVKVPVSVAPFALQVGDQALVVTPDGEIGLLVREK